MIELLLITSLIGLALILYDTMENSIEIFSKAEEDRKRRLEDPIVFRATKVGIVSMWGASDSMFDKYR